MDIKYLESMLAKGIVSACIHFQDIGDVDNIVIVSQQFLCGPSALSPRCLYICDVKKLASLMKLRQNDERITVLTTGYTKIQEQFKNDPNLNLLATSMELEHLYNELNHAVFDYRRNLLSIREAIFDGCDLKKIIDSTAELFRAPIFLLDSSYRLVAENRRYYLGDAEPREYIRSILQELQDTGALSFQTVVSTGGNSGIIFISNQIISRKIRINSITIARLFIVLPPQDSILPQLNSWADDIAKCISRYFVHDDLLPNMFTRMDGFIDDIMNQKLCTEADVQKAAKIIDLSLPASYACVAVQFSAVSLKRMPINYLISQFREIFPGSSVACYGDHLLVLAPFPKKKISISYDHGALQNLLEHFHGCAGISYRSQYYAALPEMFEESLIAIRLGMAMNPQASCPIFQFSDYHVYLLLDLCNKSITAAGKQRSMSHLCSPRFLNLLRYDRENNENLSDILYTYLCCNCSVTKAAQELFMHRNTLSSKIEKIEDLLDMDLSNSNFRLILQLSYLISQYVEKVLHQELYDLEEKYELDE